MTFLLTAALWPPYLACRIGWATTIALHVLIDPTVLNPHKEA